MRMTNVAGAVRVAKRGALALAALIIVYVAAGLVGGLIPRNAAWRPPVDGVTIYIESNGVHTGLVLPKLAAGIDWRARVPAGDLRDPRYAAHDHVVFGWGERAFYLETPTWADVNARTILAAAFGSDRTLVHVEHIARPRPGEDVRAIVLRPDEYRRLAAYIAATFAPGAAALPGYGRGDVFYEAGGHYDALRTCNAWTGDALRHAGVRVGVWTPFPVTVMRWF
jgi:uncharacterized protein (TIGR02117 family)